MFTYVWAFDDLGDHEAVEAYARPFRERGGRVLFLELEAPQSERLLRNVGESRLAEKPSKRNLESSRRSLLELDTRYQLNSGGMFDEREDYLRLENTLRTPGQVADEVIAHFGLCAPAEAKVVSRVKGLATPG
ncbi:hypothetical protein KDL01_01125 [Actinospica durhamensis]|uniref:Uncharacterized protein n=1 Tax=Actinospica durhamensis TaxID=1508375 RepID=A0A941IKH4_9ACTN|nr:hypothetical protein [Actinospica durhamensis]MBR7831840.1 hypothetical protein [Actinospica durhamensis]